MKHYVEFTKEELELLKIALISLGGQILISENKDAEKLAEKVRLLKELVEEASK